MKIGDKFLIFYPKFTDTFNATIIYYKVRYVAIIRR